MPEDLERLPPAARAAADPARRRRERLSPPSTRSRSDQDRALGLIQPDVARSGGISETRRIAELAHASTSATRRTSAGRARSAWPRACSSPRRRRTSSPSSAWCSPTRCARRSRNAPVGDGEPAGRRPARRCPRARPRHRARLRRPRALPDRLSRCSRARPPRACALVAPAQLLLGRRHLPVRRSTCSGSVCTARPSAGAPTFVGLANYAPVLGDPYFWRALLATPSSSSPSSSMSSCCSALADRAAVRRAACRGRA